MSAEAMQVTVRDAAEADLPALVAIKGEGSGVLHQDRLRDAQRAGFRYLVALAAGEVVGLACLVAQRPAYWSDGADTQHLPQVVDLQVAEARRGLGYGSAFLRAIERLAAASGASALYLTVEPHDNPRAYQFYLRLGYQPEQPEPYLKAWEFRDSAGALHRGENRVVDMKKYLIAE